MGLNVMNMAAATVVLGASLGIPLAELGESDKQAQFRPLPVSMSMAVEAAEAATPGQAINAQLEITEGRPVYEIYMLGVDLSLSRVEVDAQDGEVAIVIGEEEEHPTKEEIVQPQQGGAI